ncbi:DNA-methyltransferase [Leptospira santarosai]|uniref:DNA-methyltransferase n=1 Tax=Leptospira santarosai TaxID=28183 RepID=UPI0007749137|nr:site-specific DNA-methyltransferase [Leptospira santarosai]MDI7196326.1 site-specific DNA-methyltransferase [Leptospira santarosai]MDI7202102.1 site-specific DNA-methyltransferase [Leptospira santarosai]
MIRLRGLIGLLRRILILSKRATLLFSLMATHHLYYGDCLENLPKIPDSSVDLILCDLPYGTTDCSWDVIIPMERLWPEYERISKERTPVILTGSQPFTNYLINSNPKNFRYELIWYKTKASGFLNAKSRPNKSHENILIFYGKQPVYNPIKYVIDERYKRKGKTLGNGNQSTVFTIRGEKSENYQYLDDGSRYPDSVLCFPSESEIGMHPTQKPLKLLRYLIKTYSNPGDTVLDNCMGHGTTGIAATELGRNFIGMERDKEYFNKAQRKIQMAETRTQLELNFES